MGCSPSTHGNTTLNGKSVSTKEPINSQPNHTDVKKTSAQHVPVKKSFNAELGNELILMSNKFIELDFLLARTFL